MRTALAIALMIVSVSAAAQEPPLPIPTPIRELPAQYICSISRETPAGTIGAQRSVSLDGVSDEPLFSWETAFDEGKNFRLHASWGKPPRNYSGVQIIFDLPGERPSSYRLRLEEASRNGQPTLDLDSGPIPGGEGWIYVFTSWRTLTGIIADADVPEFVVLGDGREIFRSEPIELARFQDARAAAEALEPELAPLVADYAKQCRFYQRETLED